MNPRTSLVIVLAASMGCVQNTELAEYSGTVSSSESFRAEENAELLAQVDPQVAVDEVQENLALLENLDVFSVGQLLLDVPGEAFNCYGPCPEWKDEIAEAEIEAASRLAVFADLALEASAGVSTSNPFPEERIDENLEALRDLEIVEVGTLIEDEPVVTGNCYHLPCTEEIAAAEERNNDRAWQLQAIVTSTTGL
jgi:hypothetical protein